MATLRVDFISAQTKNVLLNLFDAVYLLYDTPMRPVRSLDVHFPAIFIGTSNLQEETPCEVIQDLRDSLLHVVETGGEYNTEILLHFQGCILREFRLNFPLARCPQNMVRMIHEIMEEKSVNISISYCGEFIDPTEIVHRVQRQLFDGFYRTGAPEAWIIAELDLVHMMSGLRNLHSE